MLRLLSSAGTAIALAASLFAQSTLNTIHPFASNHATDPGGGVYFDLTVHSGVAVSQLDCNLRATGLPGVVFVYTRPGTSVGFEQTLAGWTLVRSIPVTAAGIDLVTPCVLNPSVVLTPGNYGVAICAHAMHQHITTGSNRTFSTAEMTINLGRANNVCLYSGSPPFSGYVWNGSIHYTRVGVFADFVGTPTTGNSPLTVNFADSSVSYPNPLTSWLWDFENDGTVDSSLQNPTHVYPICGNYDVRLTVSDGTTTSTELKTGYIVVDPLIANFTAAPTAGVEPLVVNFTDTSTGGSATATAWAWDFENDGTIDSTLQNPAFTYLSGIYTVRLTTTFDCGGGTASVTKTNLIRAIGLTTNTAGAQLFEFQFNEVRYGQVFNAASTKQAPEFATVIAPLSWKVDAGRTGFQGDGATGALGNGGRVVSGHSLHQDGSMTICWWQRMHTIPGPAAAFPFGGSGTSGWGCFTSGIAGTQILYRGSSIGDVQSTTVDMQSAPGLWQHVCLVVDDVAGTATWHLDGVADAAPVAFAAGTHTATTISYFIGFQGGSLAPYTNSYDMDDYRHYAVALTAAEVAALAAGSENAASTKFGFACAGTLGDPVISANSTPNNQTGNPGYSIGLDNAEANTGAFLAFGFDAANALLPFDLGGVLGANYAGCNLETDVATSAFYLTDALGAAGHNLAIPAGGAFKGVHIYAQWLVLDSTVGALSRALDINIE